MVKITVPVSHPDEVEMLAGNGAGELYCGFVPPEWLARYGGAFWLNRRGPVAGNLQRSEEVTLVAERARAGGIPLFVTFNAPYYTQEQQEFLLPVVGALAAEAGIDGVIVSDLGFLVSLREAYPGLPVHASSVVATLNPGMVEFLASLGAARVIFPRSLSVRDIAALCGAAAGRIETEAFVLNEGCVFEEGYCMTTHRTAGALCVQLPEVPHRFVPVFGAPPAAGPPEGGRELLGSFRDWVWFQNGCGNTMTAGGIPNGPCALCALFDLARTGVTSVKIAGRSSSPFRKLASLQLVRAVLDLVERGATREEVAGKSRALRNTPDFCDARYMCYYREAHP
ncbi:MAG TPA: U32 family peptidase [Candidatus Deferrimicrobiaceae bacterium]